MKLDPLTPYAKINSQWITDLKARAKVLESIGAHLPDSDLDNGFLDMTPIEQAIKEKSGEIGQHQSLKLLYIKHHQ